MQIPTGRDLLGSTKFCIDDTVYFAYIGVFHEQWFAFSLGTVRKGAPVNTVAWFND